MERGNVYEAADGGHLEVLKYAHENGCPWDHLEVLDTLANMCSQLEVLLKYAQARTGARRNSKHSATKAARVATWKCCSTRTRTGVSLGEYTCRYAAEGGHLEELQYLARERVAVETD